MLVFHLYRDRPFLAGLAWAGMKFTVLKPGNAKALVTSRMLQAAQREEVKVIAAAR